MQRYTNFLKIFSRDTVSNEPMLLSDTPDAR